MIVTCPHCHEFVWIDDIGCGIFRHGYDKDFKPIYPHASQVECELKTFYGCGKPFRIIARDVPFYFYFYGNQINFFVTDIKKIEINL